MKYLAEISIFKPSAIADDIDAAAQEASAKNTNFYSLLADVPTATAVGDNWFVQDASGHCIGIKRWDGSAWVDEPLTGDVLAANSIKAIHIDFQTLSGQTIEGLEITGGTYKTILGSHYILKIVRNPPEGHGYMWYPEPSGTQDEKIEIEDNQIVAKTAAGTVRSFLVPVLLKLYSGGDAASQLQESIYGWLAEEAFVAHRIFTGQGEVASKAPNDWQILADHVTPITISANDLFAGTPISGWGGCWYYKIGSHVHLHIAVSGLTADTNTHIFTMPDGFWPPRDKTINAAGRGSNGSEVCNLWITNSSTEYGFVYIRSVAATGIADIEYDAFV